METPHQSLKRLVIVIIALLVLATPPAGAEDHFTNFYYRTASQLTKNAAVLAGIAAELDNRFAQRQEGCDRQKDFCCTAESLNDVELVLLLGGELLGGSQKIDTAYQQDHYQHLVAVLKKTNQQISDKLELIVQAKEKTGNQSTADHISRAIKTIEKSMQLLDQSAKNLATQSLENQQISAIRQ